MLALFPECILLDLFFASKLFDSYSSFIGPWCHSSFLYGQNTNLKMDRAAEWRTDGYMDLRTDRLKDYRKYRRFLLLGLGYLNPEPIKIIHIGTLIRLLWTRRSAHALNSTVLLAHSFSHSLPSSYGIVYYFCELYVVISSKLDVRSFVPY